MEAILVSNGPGELYTWVQPLVKVLKKHYPNIRIHICLIPCQFASGKESEIAKGFGVSSVKSPQDFLAFRMRGEGLLDLHSSQGFVLSLGGNSHMALHIAKTYRLPCYRYTFSPHWNKGFAGLFVHDEAARHKALNLGAPQEKVHGVGNLVADAVEAAPQVDDTGEPHVLLMLGSRPQFLPALLPLYAALVDRLGRLYPQARFVAPLSRLISGEVLEHALSGKGALPDISVPCRREGDSILTPNGSAIELLPEEARYSQMRSATIALSIPGTNTLELGIAHLPSIILLPLNQPEVIPLEGIAHWIGKLPLIGKYIKRWAILAAVRRGHASLPNRLSGEEIMLEFKKIIVVDEVVGAAQQLLDDEGARRYRQERLAATMPHPGAAQRLLAKVLRDIEG